jgi:hypothetical protein
MAGLTSALRQSKNHACMTMASRLFSVDLFGLILRSRNMAGCFAKEEILGDERCAGRKEETGPKRATWHSTSVRYAAKNLDLGDFEDARTSKFNQNPRASTSAPDLLEA